MQSIHPLYWDVSSKCIMADPGSRMFFHSEAVYKVCYLSLLFLRQSWERQKVAHCAAFVRNRKCKAILLSSALHVSKICRYTSDTWHTSNVASGILPRSSRDKGGSRLLRNNEYVCKAISRIKCSNETLKASYHEREAFYENNQGLTNRQSV